MLIDDGRGKMIDIRQEIIDFAIQMEIAMSDNDLEKGDSWRVMDIVELVNKKSDKDEVTIDESTSNSIDVGLFCELLIDQSNYNMMIWNRFKEN